MPQNHKQNLFQFQVCLATQTSIDRAHWLLKTVETWSGPISVAIFTPDLEFDISVRFVNFMRNCHPKVLRQVSFHFVYPVSRPMRESEELVALTAGHAASCDQDPKEFLHFLLQIQVIFTTYNFTNVFLNVPSSACFSFIFVLSKTNYNFYNE